MNIAALRAHLETLIGLAPADMQEVLAQMSLILDNDEHDQAIRHHDDLDKIMRGLTTALSEFDTAVSGEFAQRADGLTAARRRFAIHLGALLEADDILENVERRPLTTAVIQLRSQLRELAKAVSDVIDHAATAAAAQRELELAGAVQQLLVRPTEDGQEVAGLSVGSWFVSAEEVAGDWWSLEPLGEGALLVLGDVTGHGAPAALVAATAKGACDLARLGMREALRPFMLFNMLNQVIHDAVDGEFLMTGITARWIQNSKQLALANAGHRSLWLIREGKMHAVKGSGDPPLGTRRVHKYQEMALQLRQGDRVVVFTDGIPEAENAQEQPFGERGMREAILIDELGTPHEICARIRDAMHAHIGDQPVDDDTTLIVLYVN